MVQRGFARLVVICYEPQTQVPLANRALLFTIRASCFFHLKGTNNNIFIHQRILELKLKIAKAISAGRENTQTAQETKEELKNLLGETYAEIEITHYRNLKNANLLASAILEMEKKEANIEIIEKEKEAKIEIIGKEKEAKIEIIGKDKEAKIQIIGKQMELERIKRKADAGEFKLVSFIRPGFLIIDCLHVF